MNHEERGKEPKAAGQGGVRRSGEFLWRPDMQEAPLRDRSRLSVESIISPKRSWQLSRGWWPIPLVWIKARSPLPSCVCSSDSEG